jgi:hypothetical protein
MSVPADSWSLSEYSVTGDGGKTHKISCYGHTLKGSDNITSHLAKYFKSLGQENAASSLLKTPIKPSDLTSETKQDDPKSIMAAKQQAEKDTQQAVQAIKLAQTQAIKSNVSVGSTPNPTMTTTLGPPPVGKPTVMTTSSDGSKAKANPTIGDALVSLQTAVGDQAEKLQKTVTDTVQGAVEKARDTLKGARETAAATITDAAKAISPKSATENTPAAMTMPGGRRRTKRRKRRRKHKTKHKRKKKRTTRKRKKRTRRRRR